MYIYVFQLSRASVLDTLLTAHTQPTRVVALSPRASLGQRTVCGRTEQRRPPGLKRYETKVCIFFSFIAAGVNPL